MSYTLLALTIDYKIGDKIVCDVVTTSLEKSILINLQKRLNVEYVELVKDMKLKLAILTGKYHNFIYSDSGVESTPESISKSTSYYTELANIESHILSKYMTLAKYIKSKDISKLLKSKGFNLIEIKE